MVENNELVLGAGELQNVSAIPRPDGTLDPHLTRKVFPTPDERAFSSAATLEQLAAYDTPAGKLAVLICADSWFPTSYAALAGEGPRIIVVPNNFISDVGWDEKFPGIISGPKPEDVDPADIGRITQGEAWLKYTLDGRMQNIGATTGMHVFFRGDIWGLISHGHTIIFTEDGPIEASPDARGAVVNYWLPEKNGA
jgi:predicted amidohydrolase